jgi:vitamin B12 transporter
MTSGIQRDEVRRPGNTGSVNANYILGKSNLNLNVSYNGEQFDDYFPPFPTPQEVVTLGSYTLVTLSYRYNINDALQLTTRLENLLDEQYEEVFGYRAPGLAGHLGISFQL